jgi:hypothetical protein
MKRRILIAVASVLGSALLVSCLPEKKDAPITITVSGLYRKMTIDELIRNADLIVIGTIEGNLPSRWKAPDGQNDRVPTPEELSDARGLLTDSVLRIDRFLKGEFREPRVRLRSFLGELGNIRWRNESQPVYASGHAYLVFLSQDRGALAGVDPGAYVAVNARAGVYEIVGDKAISVEDQWLLTDLIAYVQAVLSAEAPSTEGPTVVAPPAETATEAAPSPMP